jgi:hypothetical protein
MFKSHPSAVFGSLVRLWALTSAEITDAAIFNAVDALTSSAQKVVEMVGEVLVPKSKADHTYVCPEVKLTAVSTRSILASSRRIYSVSKRPLLFRCGPPPLGSPRT